MPNAIYNLSNTRHELIMYAKWTESDLGPASLWIGNRTAAMIYVDKMAKTEIKARFITCLDQAVSSDSPTESLYVEDMTARSLTHYLIHMCIKEGISHVPSEKFELIGFWEPPTGIPNGSGMFIWHESGVYQTHIVFCRNEAKQVLSGLPIERDRRLSLIHI